jgi:hypothetical protein
MFQFYRIMQTHYGIARCYFHGYLPMGGTGNIMVTLIGLASALTTAESCLSTKRRREKSPWDSPLNSIEWCQSNTQPYGLKSFSTFSGCALFDI